MPDTRQALVEAATAAFAAEGTFTASLVEVTRRIYAGELKSDPSNLSIAIGLLKSKTQAARP